VSDDRELVLRALRAARATAAGAHPEPASRPGARPATLADADLAAAFARRARDASARVLGPVAQRDAEASVARLLRERGVRRLLGWDDEELLPHGLLDGLAGMGFQVLDPRLAPEPAARAHDLIRVAEAEAGITGAALALADTGALVLPSGPTRSRLAWTLPGYLLIVCPVSAIRPRTADALDEIRRLARRASQVSILRGPSRSHDIALEPTPGAFGPELLDVLLTA
jgi:L-lactate dehydrogenase complex protein LldG